MKKKRYNKTALLLKHLQHRGVEGVIFLRSVPTDEAFRKYITAKYTLTAHYKGQAIETLGETKLEAIMSTLWIIDIIDKDELPDD